MIVDVTEVSWEETIISSSIVHARHASEQASSQASDEQQAVYRLDSHLASILEQRKMQHKDHSKNQINVNIIRFLRRYQIEDSRPCLLAFSVHK